jgi:hypothetical protein
MSRLHRSARAALTRGLAAVDDEAQLTQARRALGAGPIWGRPAAAALLVASVGGLLSGLRADWFASPQRASAAAVLLAVALGVAVRWSRGVDFDLWVEADPRHRRGSCQWLIWRGEYSGQPCLACRVSMPRQGRRRWMAAAASPAVAVGWLGEPTADADRPVRLRDAGVVRVGWLVWQLLPAGLLALAVHQWVSGSPADRQTALPLALATVLTAAIALHRGSDAADEEAAGGPAAGAGVCESCDRMPATVTVRFPDAVLFAVCGTCLAAGVHSPAVSPGAAAGPSAREVSR